MKPSGKRKPKPPVWCMKPKPCDYDPPCAYCPHRECRQRREAMLAGAVWLAKRRTP